MNPQEKPQAGALTPAHSGFTAKTYEDILFLGKPTIGGIICTWRSTAKDLAKRIKRLDRMSRLLYDKTATVIRKMAERFEHPKFPGIRLLENTTDKPVLLDPASLRRKPGTTTFNVCGWCKYALCDTFFNCPIAAICDIENTAGLTGDKRQFNATCFLRQAPKDKFDEIRDSLYRKLKALVEEKGEVDGKIKCLLLLKKSAEKKPAMPKYRPSNWFTRGNPVICFIGKCRDRLVPEDFIEATILETSDGRVTVYYNEHVHPGDYLEGYGAQYGESHPEVMHPLEFKYLLRNPEFAKLWLTQGDSTGQKKFDAEHFLKALNKEARIVARAN